MSLDLRKLNITNIKDGIPGGAGSGDTIYFIYEGTHFRFESWSTDNSSGSDFYQSVPYQGQGDVIPDEINTRWLPASLRSDIEEELAQLFDEHVLPEWWDIYRKYVNPALEKATAETVASVNSELSATHEAGLR